MGQAHQLQRDGFLVIQDLLDSQSLQDWCEVVSAWASGNARNLLRSPEIRALVTELNENERIRSVLGSKAFPARALLFNKQQGANWSVGWHQDTVIAVDSRPEEIPAGYGSWSVKKGIPHVRPPVAVLESMLTVRLALDDADETNGALQVIPKTHLGGILGEEQIARAIQEADRYSCACRAGDALIMKPLLLHASGKAQRMGRRVVHTEYANEPLPEPLRWPRWEADA